MPWQRCQFHLPQNAAASVPRQALRAEVAADIQQIVNAPSRTVAEADLKRTVEKSAQTARHLADWLAANIPEGMPVCAFPQAHQRRLRTSNGLARINRESRRRIRVVSIFPNQAACLRLVSARLVETDEQWQAERIYLSWEAEIMTS